MNRDAARRFVTLLVSKHFNCRACMVLAGTPCGDTMAAACRERHDAAEKWASDWPCAICGEDTRKNVPMGCDDEAHVHPVCDVCFASKFLRIVGRLDRLRACPYTMTDADRALAVLARGE